jgi:hypothetical protein
MPRGMMAREVGTADKDEVDVEEENGDDDNIDVDEEDDDNDGGSNDGDRGDAIVVPSKEQIALCVGSSWRITVGVLSN